MHTVWKRRSRHRRKRYTAMYGTWQTQERRRRRITLTGPASRLVRLTGQAGSLKEDAGAGCHGALPLPGGLPAGYNHFAATVRHQTAGGAVVSADQTSGRYPGGGDYRRSGDEIRVSVCGCADWMSGDTADDADGKIWSRPQYLTEASVPGRDAEPAGHHYLYL